MIVEDENGQDIYLNDLDDRNDSPEPDEPPEPEPVNLDGIAAAYASHSNKDDGHHNQAAAYLLDSIPGLADEIKTLREELAYWRALPLRTEYATAVGGNTHPDDCTQAWHTEDSDQALAWHKNVPGSRMWTRSVTVHEWIGLSAEAPF